ncbi:MAG: c-type cytochrome [Cyclobacteriaceae bacterium]
MENFKQLRLAVMVLTIAATLSLLLIISIPLIQNGVIDVGQSKLIVDPYNRTYNISQLGTSKLDRSIRLGHELIVNTPQWIGPDSRQPYAGNNLSCTNCHLDAGTKTFAAPYIGLTNRFPQFRSREGKIGTIEERINGCMERSMNGQKLPEDSREMKAMVAYMEWLSEGVSESLQLEGLGFVSIAIPNRKVDLQNGQELYQTKCASCHQSDGQGVNGDGKYTYPPLWGQDTYNNGAGMHRVITAAQFIKGNMPLGATADNPLLTDEEAFDIAGYINSFQRPIKDLTDQDFPDKTLKPVSTPYEPFADPFDPEQHKYGPFQEIMAYYETEYGIKKTK